MGSVSGKLAHRRKDAALDRAIHGDLPETFQRAVAYGDRLGVGCVTISSYRTDQRDEMSLRLVSATLLVSITHGTDLRMDAARRT